VPARDRGDLLARDKLYAATLVSVVAYRGLRTRGVLAVEVRHVRASTVRLSHEPIKTAALRRWRDPDSNRGHRDFQLCRVVSETG
jgi:hypothetical protein